MFSVLYVDDERDLLDLGKFFLEQSPEFHIEIASSAREALASPGFKSFDAIVSDYQMPEMDGIAFLKTVRKQYGNVPFILFTGRGREEIVIEAINNGVDFYLQKGGDVRSQFAELSHKIRQAVARRRVERSLVESEKRLADIINFLPDATLAINRDGIIIAWNRAIEEMTGLSSESMLGKGNHEYALPFYGERRPILIDLIFETDEVIEQKYSHIVREKDVLIADTTFPVLRGKAVTLLGKASPLYNSQGEIVGAIEAIRDITERKKEEDELRAAYEQITASEEELRDQLDELAESEKKIRESEARLRYMIGFYEKAKGPEQELLGYAVEGAGAVTGSFLGYLAFLNNDESELSMYAWSKSAMKECAMQDKPLVYKTEKTGLWGEAVRQRRAVITNDYAAPNPAKKGYPHGHPEIVRHMNIPVIDGGHIVLVAGVANKSSDYTDTDIQELSLLMQSLWLVVKRRRTEQALFESEEKYRDLFENAVVGNFQTTLEGQFSAINSTFARITGYATPQDMMEAITDIRTQLYVNPKDRDWFVNALKTEGFVKNFEAEFKHRDGHPIRILINAMAVSDMQGAVRYYEGTIEDITEQKNAQEALKREKTFSDAVIDSIPGLLYLYDSEGLLVRWNKAHESITGYSAGELAGMHVLDWFKGDDKAISVITESVGQALREGQGTAEANLRTRSGTKIPFFFTAKRLEIEGKTYFTGVGIDITERKRAQDELRAAYEKISASEEELREQVHTLADNQAALKHSEEKYRTLIETSPDIIWEMDASGVFTYMSPRSTEIIGYLPEQVIGKPALSFVTEKKLPELRELFETVLTSENLPPWFDLPLQRPDGQEVTLEIRAARIPRDDNRPLGLRGTAHDITERKKIADDLSAAYNQLAATEEELRSQYDELARSEQRIRESEEQLRNVIDHSPFGMHFYELKNDGPLIFSGANPAADTILGVNHRELIGRPIEAAFLGLASTEIPEQYRRVAAVGNPWHNDQIFYSEGKISGAFSVVAFRTRPGAMTAMFFDITERKRAEEALRESEARYRRITDNARDLIYRMAIPSGIYEYVSRASVAMTGYTPEELYADPGIFRTMIHPDWKEYFLQQWNDLSECRVAPEYEYQIIDRAGKMRWFNQRNVLITDEHGGPVALEGIVTDISDRKQAEIALQEKTEEINQYFTTSLDLFCIADTDGYFRRLNPAWEKTLGYALAELEGKRFIDFVHPDDLKDTLTAVAELRLQKSVLNFTNRFRHKDGTYRWIEWRSFPRGNLIYAAARDITARRDSEEKYRKLFEQSNDAIFVVDSKTWKITDCNRKAELMTGFSCSDLVGIDAAALHPEDVREVTREYFREFLTSKTTSIESVILAKDGIRVPVSINAGPVEVDGQILLIGTFRDITPQKQAENALRESEERYRSVIENLEDAFIRTNAEGCIIMASPQHQGCSGMRHLKIFLAGQ